MPADKPVTRPVELTVATVVFEEVQALLAAAVPEPDSCVVFSWHKIRTPVIVGIVGTKVTVAVLLVASGSFFVPVMVAWFV